MTQSTINLARGIAYALNYHSLDAKLNTADWELADMLAPFVAHGTECSKQGLDPAMTPNSFLPPSPERKTTPVEALAERLAKVEDRLAGLLERIDVVDRAANDEFNQVAEALAEIRRLTLTPAVQEPAFPTGGASTAEAAIDAVLPVPQRGDRVRLAGATSTGQTHVKDGWYDVTGFHKAADGHDQFQVGTPNGGLYWFYVDTSALKEVRHAEHT